MLGTPGEAGDPPAALHRAQRRARRPPTAASSSPSRTTRSSWTQNGAGGDRADLEVLARRQVHQELGRVRLRPGAVPRAALAGDGFEGPAVRRGSRQPPHPDLRSGRQAPRHLVSVQPHQRALHRRQRHALRDRLGVRRQLQPGLAQGAPRGQRAHRGGVVTSCPSTCRSSPRAWAATGRWARAWRSTRRATSSPARSGRCRG